MTTTKAQTADHWYENRHLLEEGQVFRMYDDSLVKLDRRVPCDGTQWYVATFYTHLGRFLYEDAIVEPGDLRGEPLPDPAEARHG